MHGGVQALELDPIVDAHDPDWQAEDLRSSGGAVVVPVAASGPLCNQSENLNEYPTKAAA